MKLKLVAALLAGSAFAYSVPAFAQEPPAGQEAPEPTEPDQSDAAADAAIADAAPVDDAQAKIDLMQAQIEALQESIAQIKANQAKATPSWKGAPELADKDAGFTFKPKGFMQFDAGYVGFPDGEERNAIVEARFRVDCDALPATSSVTGEQIFVTVRLAGKEREEELTPPVYDGVPWLTATARGTCDRTPTGGAIPTPLPTL